MSYVEELEGLRWNEEDQTGRLNFLFTFKNSDYVLCLVDCSQFKNFPIWHVYDAPSPALYSYNFATRVPNIIDQRTAYVLHVFQELRILYELEKRKEVTKETSSRRILRLDALLLNKIVFGHGIGQYNRAEVLNR